MVTSRSVFLSMILILTSVIALQGVSADVTDGKPYVSNVSFIGSGYANFTWNSTHGREYVRGNVTMSYELNGSQTNVTNLTVIAELNNGSNYTLLNIDNTSTAITLLGINVTHTIVINFSDVAGSINNESNVTVHVLAYNRSNTGSQPYVANTTVKGYKDGYYIDLTAPTLSLNSGPNSTIYNQSDTDTFYTFNLYG